MKNSTSETLTDLAWGQGWFIKEKHREAARDAHLNIEFLQNQINGFAKEKEILNQEIAKARKIQYNLDQSNTDRNKLLESNLELEEKNKSLQKDLENACSDRVSLNTENYDLQSQLDRLKDELARERSERLKLEETLKSRDEEITLLAERTVSSEGKLEDLKENVQVVIKHLQTSIE